MHKISELFEGKESSFFKGFQEAYDRYKDRKTDFAVQKAVSERADVISQILAIINLERHGTKYKPYSPKVLAIKLSHIRTADLYFLLSQGKLYKSRHGSFSKYIFGSIKIKK